MSVIVGVAAVVFGVMNFISVVADVFGRRRFDESLEATAARLRRMVLNLAVLVAIVGGFFAIVYFGPLRPVHEWIR